MKLIRSIFWICIIITSQPAQVLEANQMVFATTLWPPYEMKIGENISGIDVDIIREFIKINNINATIISVPWKRALVNAQDGIYHAIFSLKESPEREVYFHFPNEILSYDRIRIFSIYGENIRAKKLFDLRKYKIGIVRGYIYGKEFQSSVFLDTDLNVNDQMMIDKLVLGRYKLIAGNQLTLSYIASQQDLKLEEVYFLSDDPMYIGFSKRGTKEYGKKLALMFDATMVKLKKAGYIKQTIKKYFDL